MTFRPAGQSANARTKAWWSERGSHRRFAAAAGAAVARPSARRCICHWTAPRTSLGSVASGGFLGATEDCGAPSARHTDGARGEAAAGVRAGGEGA